MSPIGLPWAIKREDRPAGFAGRSFCRPFRGKPNTRATRCKVGAQIRGAVRFLISQNGGKVEAEHPADGARPRE